MSHLIEQFTDSDGKVHSFAAFGNRQSAWHQLGHVAEGNMTGKELLDNAHLGGWNVRKVPSNVIDETGEVIEVPNQYTNVRTHPITGKMQPFDSAVGSIYTPIQNEEAIALAEAIIDVSDGRAVWDTGGALRDGRNVFLTLKLDHTMRVGGVDPLALYLAILNSHDGRGALIALVTPVRVVCANTQAAALANFQAKHKIWHTTHATQRIEIARQELSLSFAYADALQDEFDRMVQAPASDRWFQTHVMRFIWPEPQPGDSKRAFTIHQVREDRIMDLWRNSPTLVSPSGESIKGTKYGAYQTIVEDADFYAPVAANKLDPQGFRAQRVITGALDDVKHKAFNRCRVLAKKA